MMDLVLQGTQVAIRDMLVGRGLITAATEFDGSTSYVGVPGFDYAWWQGSGKFQKTAAVIDAQGNVTTPATYVAGFVMLCRISDPNDNIDNPDDDEQWSRSKVIRFLKNNGVLGSFQGFPCYTYQSVRILRARDVFAWLAAQGFAGHEFMGGNSI